MKRKYTYLLIRHILLALLVPAFVCCTSEEYTQASGLGWVDFSINTASIPDFPASNPAYSLTVASADGAFSHTWPTAEDYPKHESYSVGRYRAVAVSGDLGAEGYDCPCYCGQVDFDVAEAKHSVIDIDCSLSQAIVNISFGEGLVSASPQAVATVHSSGHGYVDADASKEGPIYLSPGATYIYVAVYDASGRSATVAPDFCIETQASNIYDISIDLISDNLLEVKCSDAVSQTPISEKLFDSAPPSISAQGFVSGVPFGIMEGFPIPEPIKMIVKAPAGLSAAILTSVGGGDELPAECDLLSDAASFDVKNIGVDMLDNETLIVDFTDFLENVGVQTNSSFSFLLQARDKLNRVSQACILQVEIKSVDLSEVGQSYSSIVSGFATVDVALSSPDFKREDFEVFILNDNEPAAQSAQILDLVADSERMMAHIKFALEPGLDDVDARIDFMGNPKLFFKVLRTVPEYELFIDAFALSANIYVTSEDEILRDFIIDNATPIVNGAVASILDRNVKAGCITIAQLSPATSYDISTVLIPGRYAPMSKATTEKAEQVPSGDFEDFEDLIQYKRLPRGGVYSNTIFPIFNMQNFTEIDVKWPQKHWSGTNDKTFCKSAYAHNTWYMYPSAMLDFSASASGTKSMKMQSVGWSLNGPEIPPYKQEDGSASLSYNANVPEVAHHSAGKVFLGSYKFDPASLSESYVQGVAFSSRPRSLNGFFQYVSDVSSDDNGLVVIELINDLGPEPVIVASASMRFPSSPGFTSFNLPLNYQTIGVKATKLCIMFSSSYHCGSIAEEDESVPVTPNPELGMFCGSALRVDNLSFSY
ncbi:MAG: DUF4493 domain-containing protein [Clostridium sp.]|nr:DUF4493 domain-containing protein [Clostridium sp.]